MTPYERENPDLYTGTSFSNFRRRFPIKIPIIKIKSNYSLKLRVKSVKKLHYLKNITVFL